LSRGLSKLSDEIRKERDLQIVVEKLCNSLRKGRRPKKVIKACLTPDLSPNFASFAPLQLAPWNILTAGALVSHP